MSNGQTTILGAPVNAPLTGVPTPTIDIIIGKQELEITGLRNALLIAAQYAAAFPDDPNVMPASVQGQIATRLTSLIAMQIEAIGQNNAPTP